MSEPDVNDLDTTMSFVLKIRHRAWIKQQTEAAKKANPASKASDSETLRRILDAAMDAEKKTQAAA